MGLFCQQNSIPSFLCPMAYNQLQRKQSSWYIPKSWHVSNGHASLFAHLDCTHKEADDRIMFHIQDILCHQTDLFSIKHQDLTELWFIRNSGVKRSILPLHTMCSNLNSDLLKCLPALHPLSFSSDEYCS